MGTNDEFIYHNTSCGVVKLNKGIPPGTLSFVPYGIKHSSFIVGVL